MPTLLLPTLLPGRLIQRLTVLLVLTSFGVAAFVHPSPAHATSAPTATDSAGHFAEMLDRLPCLPLGPNEILDIQHAMVIYTDFALQDEALGITPPLGDDDTEEQAHWIQALGPLLIPHTLQDWWSDEWRQQSGFNLYQTDQAVEYYTPYGAVSGVLRGRFDHDELRSVWMRRGHEPVDLGAGESYARPEDREVG